jgi:hypothetical protein
MDRGAAPWSRLQPVGRLGRPESLQVTDLPDVIKRRRVTVGARSIPWGQPRRTTLEDVTDRIPVFGTVSRTWSSRVNPDRPTVRPSRGMADLERNPLWDGPSKRRRTVPGSFFDPDYATFRTMLQSLAADGHRFLGQHAGGSSQANSRQARGLIGRIDQFEELAASRGIETVRRWAHRLRTLVLQAGDEP